jgi:nitric oxide reductase activation protein
VEFHIAKGFDEPWSSQAAQGLAGLAPRGSTRTGAAVRHAAQWLAREPEPHKALIVLSDGYPQDSDYGDRPGDTEYGLHDTGRALREAEAAGITTMSVSIDAAAHDYLRTICPPDRYLVIDDVHQLGPRLAELCARLRRQAVQTRSGRSKRPLLPMRPMRPTR